MRPRCIINWLLLNFEIILLLDRSNSFFVPTTIQFFQTWSCLERFEEFSEVIFYFLWIFNFSFVMCLVCLCWSVWFVYIYVCFFVLLAVWNQIRVQIQRITWRAKRSMILDLTNCNIFSLVVNSNNEGSEAISSFLDCFKGFKKVKWFEH